MALRMLQKSFPSRTSIEIAEKKIHVSMSGNKEQIQLAMKQCIEQHDLTLQEVVATDPKLAIMTMASTDSLYWLINTSMKSWIGEGSLLTVRYDSTVFGSQPRVANIHIKAIAGAWSRAEQQSQIPDSMVQLACKWLDAYSPNAEIERVVESPYASGAASLRKRQVKQ